MAQLIAANNAQSTLAGSISNTAAIANLASGSGILFAAPSAGQYFVGTFTDAATGLLHEIVWVTAVTGDQITMSRAQEGTTGLNWSANDLFGNLMTAGQLKTLVQAYQAQQQPFNYSIDTGAVNAYLLAFTPTVSVAPGAGAFPIRMVAANTNTGPATLNAGWGAVAIVRRNGSALIGGEIIANEITELFWTGTVFQYLYVAPATAAAISGATDTQTAVTPAQLANASFAFPGATVWAATINTPAGWLLSYGQAVSRSTYANLFAAITKAATVTLSIASPGVVGWTGHGLAAGSPVSFETTGGLPTGLSTATNYYVVSPSTNSFNVAATPGGSPIAFTGSQSGTQTGRFNPYGCGDGSTTFNLPDGRDVTMAGADAMGGTSRGLLGGNTSAGGFVTAAQGNQAGAQTHVQTLGELATHHHGGGNGTGSAGSGGGSGFSFANPPGTTDDTGSNTPLNITQPTLLMNLFIKL